jgi:hypothetical protein
MTAPAKKRINWNVSIVVGALVLFAVVGPLIAYKKVDNWVCPISGSTRSQIAWFGHFSLHERNTSALEGWLKHREPSFEPMWQHTSTTTYYVLARGYACGSTPEIYQLRPILDDVVGKFSDERLAGLTTILRQGSREEQRLEIQRLANEYFDTK